VIFRGRAGEWILKIIQLELDVHVKEGGITTCGNGIAKRVVIDRNVRLDLEFKPGLLVSPRMGIDEAQLRSKRTYAVNLFRHK